jgi:hypothetical protein
MPLFDVYVNEIDKKKVIGMEPSIPLEFENDKVFWWLVKESNILVFHNSGDEKIKGNYTDKLFDIAVDEFINKYYNDAISPLLRSRDSSGKRNHTSQSATDVVKGRLELYRG